LVGCCYYFFKEEPLEPQQAAGTPKEEEAATLSYAGNSITEEKDGKILWQLGAETIAIDMNTKNTTLKNIKGTLYQDNGGKIDITAPEAFIDSKTKDIVMKGTVHALASDGATFTAQGTRWSDQEQLFYGSGDVVVTKDDTVMSGDNVESDKNMEKIKVYGHAKIVKGGVTNEK
jgi:LPS export ABC transporter protein LptC